MVAPWIKRRRATTVAPEPAKKAVKESAPAAAPAAPKVAEQPQPKRRTRRSHSKGN